MEFIEAQKRAHPGMEGVYERLGELYKKKLWHQLTDEIDEFLKNYGNQMKGKTALEFYEKFVANFEQKMNQLRFAQIITVIAELSGDGETLYKNTLEKKARLGVEATLLIEMKLALIHIEKDFDEVELKRLLAWAQESLDSLSSEVTVVFSAYYLTAMALYKKFGPPEMFYKSALKYLAYTPMESMTKERQYELAIDVSLAALSGDTIYNFGEVLATPILDALLGTPKAWLREMLEIFNRADLDAYNRMMSTHRQDFMKEAVLTNRAEFVAEKIALLALMSLVFEKPSHERTIHFKEISERTQTDLDRVELLIMRALSLKLIEGSMDEVDQNLNVTWVLPRVLGDSEMQYLSDRLGEWKEKVSDALKFVTDQTPELFG